MDLSFGASSPDQTRGQKLSALRAEQAALAELAEFVREPAFRLVALMCEQNVQSKLRALLRVTTLEKLNDLKGEIRALEWMRDLPESVPTRYQAVSDEIARLEGDEAQ